jgi:hypothetical protein
VKRAPQKRFPRGRKAVVKEGFVLVAAGRPPSTKTPTQKREVLEPVEKAERQFKREFEKLKKKSILPALGRPADKLRAELWDAVHFKRLENIFYESQRRPFKEQLRLCLESAVTDVVSARVAKTMHLSAEGIAKLALQKLNGAKTVEQVPEFSSRAIHCAIAVRNAVAAAAAELYEKQLAPAKARGAGAA